MNVALHYSAQIWLVVKAKLGMVSDVQLQALVISLTTKEDKLLIHCVMVAIIVYFMRNHSVQKRLKWMTLTDC